MATKGIRFLRHQYGSVPGDQEFSSFTAMYGVIIGAEEGLTLAWRDLDPDLGLFLYLLLSGPVFFPFLSLVGDLDPLLLLGDLDPFLADVEAWAGSSLSELLGL
eukprot:gene21884-28922_t